MTDRSQISFHSLDEEWLASYSAGALSDAKRLLIRCQAALKPELSLRLAEMDQVGGALLETAKAEPLRDGFMDHLLEAVDGEPLQPPPGGDCPEIEEESQERWVPSPLNEYLARSNRAISWKKLGFGVERALLAEEDGEELYLLKARPGLKIPQHTHEGEEWALILHGGYHVGETGYAPGDLHREDEHCMHAPIVDDDKDPCITLVAIEGGLKFTNPIMRMMRPVLGL